jgi:hypothetical protein
MTACAVGAMPSVAEQRLYLEIKELRDERRLWSTAVYAHGLQSGMASVAERVTARALGEQPKLRVIEGGQPDVRQPLDESPAEGSGIRANA